MVLTVLAFQTIPLVLIPLVLGVILAATFEPIVEALQRRGQSLPRASAIAVGGGFLGIVFVLVVTMSVLVDQAAQLRRDRDGRRALRERCP